MGPPRHGHEVGVWTDWCVWALPIWLTAWENVEGHKRQVAAFYCQLQNVNRIYDPGDPQTNGLGHLKTLSLHALDPHMEEDIARDTVEGGVRFLQHSNCLGLSASDSKASWKELALTSTILGLRREGSQQPW